MFFDFAMNNIIGSSSNYFCAFCVKNLKGYYEVEKHIKYDYDHVGIQSDVKNYIKNAYEDLSFDNIGICINYAFTCICCNKIVPEYKAMYQHILSAKHRKFLYNLVMDADAIDSVVDRITNNNTHTVIFDLDLDAACQYDNYMRHKFSEQDYMNLVTNNILIWQYCTLTCDICNRIFNKPYDIRQHIEAKHVEYEDDDDSDDYDDSDDSDDYDDDLWCELCDCKLPSKSHISQHNNGRQHRSNILSKNC